MFEDILNESEGKQQSKSIYEPAMLKRKPKVDIYSKWHSARVEWDFLMQTVKPTKKKVDLEFESIKEEDEDGI